MKRVQLALIAGAFAFASSVALAQTGPSANSVGSKATRGGNTVGGSAGSAAAGGTSASTIGLGANSIGKGRTSTAVGAGGSAAAVSGKTRTDTKIRENPQMMRGQAKAKAWDGGTWSKSSTNTRIQRDGDLWSRTKSMAHEPGGKPAMSKTRVR
jgi:hypothetical protein